MKRARIGVIAAAVLAVATVAFAQKPDFSGTWQIDPEASGMAGGGGGRMGGGPMTVKQTADTLTVERSMGGNTMTTTYKLDGTESTNQMMGRGGSMEAKSTAKWDGNKLVITTTGANGSTTSTWYMDGASLVNEAQIPARGDQPAGTRKTYYKKAS